MAFGAGPGLDQNWVVMSPSGSRNTALQLARTSGVSATRTQDPASSPTCSSFRNSRSWKMISSPSENGAFGSRTLFVSMTVNGLNWTSKVSVLDFAVLPSDACDTAETDTTPARPRSSADMAIKTFLRMIPPPVLGGAGPLPGCGCPPGQGRRG